jgi:hypothetical protein
MTILTITFLVGLALIVVAVLGGGIEVKEVRIPKLTPIPRVMSFGVGCLLVLVCTLTPGLLDKSDGIHGHGSMNPPGFSLPPVAPPKSPPSSAAGRRIWKHGDSSAYLEADGGSRKFYFDQPAETLIQAGAKRDSPIFEGLREGSTYRGTAYDYANGCSPLGYDVIGEVTEDDTKVTLRGKAPRRNAACVKVGDKDEVLVFSYQRISSN